MSKVHRYRGFTIARGDYVGTSDNRLDRWYIDEDGVDLRDRRGSGWRTLAEARASIRATWAFRRARAAAEWGRQ